jgi:hypothetical protein
MLLMVTVVLAARLGRLMTKLTRIQQEWIRPMIKNNGKALIALMALTFTSHMLTPACGDGFAPPSLDEAMRFFGIGVGSGYHNKPCCPHQGQEYNKMLEGCSNPGWVAWKRSQLSCRVPHVAAPSCWPGEDGTPPCRQCVHATQWAAPTQHFQSYHQPGFEGDFQPENNESPTPAKSQSSPNLYGPDTSSDLDKTDLRQRSNVESLPNSTREPAESPQRRSIEDLLEGIGVEPGNDQATFNKAETAPAVDESKATPAAGQDLWKRLSPETRELFRREFPNDNLLPPGKSKPQGRLDSSRRGNRSGSMWW